ncbi:uncharacterized protein LOC128226594 [Mya arenaria]|uniref:uncharacterized protein LOC128226594 n=1 Tax=Mya arenaria TaxID=6604 RepID=UPI0022E51874|nr:uncharacterized protein LOC128226594 [Mya arenaria]
MGFSENIRATHTSSKVGTVLLLVVAVFYGLATTTVGWAFDQDSSVTMLYGLWTNCSCDGLQFVTVTFTGSCACQKLEINDDITGWYRALTNIALVAGGLLFVAFISSLAGICCTMSNRILAATSMIVGLAGLSMATVAVLFPQYKLDPSDGYTYFYSWYACLLAASVCLFVVTPLHFYGYPRKFESVAPLRGLRRLGRPTARRRNKIDVEQPEGGQNRKLNIQKKVAPHPLDIFEQRMKES